MQVAEAKEIINSMELTEESKDSLLSMLKDLKDGDELPNELLDRILAVVDQDPEATVTEEIDESLAYIDKNPGK